MCYGFKKTHLHFIQYLNTIPLRHCEAKRRVGCGNVREINSIVGGFNVVQGRREQFPIICPASGKTVAVCDAATVEDARAAMGAAAVAFADWSRQPPSSRAAVLERIAETLDAQSERLAAVITEEQGKPIGEALGEAAFISEEFRFAAQEATRLSGTLLTSEDPAVTRQVVLAPVGAAALFPSSNYPAAIAARKLAAALAAGCACVMRAPEEAPGAAFLIAEACLQAGAPPGLVSCLSGNPSDVTAAMITDPQCRIVSFTGSERVGRIVLGHAAEAIKPSIVELGGAAPTQPSPALRRRSPPRSTRTPVRTAPRQIMFSWKATPMALLSTLTRPIAVRYASAPGTMRTQPWGR